VWLRWYFRSLTLTNHRLLVRTGVLDQLDLIIPLSSIQAVGIRHTPFGRILHYVTLEINLSTRDAPVIFQGVPSGQLPEALFINIGRNRET
jgi:membrane protein YdbS with pleckstrin-like domain